MHTVSARLLLAFTFVAPTAAQAQDWSVPFGSAVPSSVTVGDTMSITYDVENVSTTPAGSFGVAFGVSDGTNGFAVYEDTIPSLAAGGRLTRTMTFTVPTGLDGTWTALLVADPFDMVVEADEANNGYVYPGTFTIVSGGGGSIVVANDPIPSASVGTPYTTTFTQSGAATPSWYISSGQAPPGLSMSTGGTLSGTPTSAGDYTFTVTAEQTGLTAGSASFTLAVTNGGGAITLTPTALPQATVGEPFSERVMAAGGVPPYGYQVISAAPMWLTMLGAGEDAGTVTGTPDAVGQYELLIYVVDSTGADGMGIVSLSVVEAGPLTINTSVANAVTGKAYVERVVLGGRPPYTTQITSGALPAGLTIDAAGRLAGVPTQTGMFGFEVATTDAAGATAAGGVSVAVTELQLLAIQTNAISVYVNSDADAALTASGGVPPYTWQMAGGALPAGVSFDAALGKIIGHPTQIGDATATFLVTDSEGSTAMGDVAVKVSIFISPGRNGADRRGGCVCIDGPTSGATPLLIVLLVAGLVRQRRRD